MEGSLVRVHAESLSCHVSRLSVEQACPTSVHFQCFSVRMLAQRDEKAMKSCSQLKASSMITE